MNYEIYRFDKIDSTNSHLLKLADEGFPEGSVVVADEQTGGRGRFGRKWESEPLSNLLFSVLLRPVFLERDEVFVLTFSAAVAVAEAIEDVAKVRPELKWPNDVLLGSRKVCGILLESVFSSDDLSSVVLGVGLNVNQRHFPAEISARATSLSVYTGKKFDRDEILSAILGKFASIYETVRARDFYSVMKKWRDRSNMFGRKIRLRLADKVYEGICDEITDDGAIVVQTSTGFKTFTAGEISIIGEEG
ncbi:MAG: biotin--[acetyl-CoA-carboxylase] ligase [Bacteroidetes bacterium]|nr:biotin--[acetyl-CoA-carboxylase] ligase [Bacteroidota bacterium]